MKKLLTGLLCAVMLAGLFPATAAARTDYQQLRQEIEELRSLINLLVQSMNNNQINVPAGQPGIPQISTQRAREAAVAFLGHGTARDVVLFTENNALIFEVEVRHQNVRYMVYVNAANGNVIRMSRHEDGYVGITTLPEVVPPVIAPPVAPPPPPPQHHGGRPPGVNHGNFDRNVQRWGAPPSNPTVGQWWGSSYVWDGHRWNSSIGWGGGRGR